MGHFNLQISVLGRRFNINKAGLGWGEKGLGSFCSSFRTHRIGSLHLRNNPTLSHNRNITLQWTKLGVSSEFVTVVT